MDNAATLLLADAQLKINNNEYDIATDRIIAALRVARHTDNQQYLLAVQLRIEAVGSAAKIAMLAPTESWSDEQATRILTAFEWYSGDDPFGLRRVAEQEADRFIAWMRKSLENPEQWRRILRLTTSLADWSGVKVQPTTLVIVMAIQQYGGMERCIAGYQEAAEMMIEVIDAPDRDAKLNYLTDRLRKNQFGPIARTYVSNTYMLWNAEEAALADLQRFQDSILRLP